MLLAPGKRAAARRSLLRIMRIHYNHAMRFGCDRCGIHRQVRWLLVDLRSCIQGVAL
jgi:hypothetical protein